MKQRLALLVAFLASATVLSAAAAPKRILLITTSTGFRHSSIEPVEKVLRELAAKSGDFTIISTSEHPDYPNYGGGRGGGPQLPGAAPAQQAAVTALTTSVAAANTALTAARTALNTAAFTDRASITAKAKAVADAELALATARAEGFARIQASPNKLTREQAMMVAGVTPIPAPNVNEQVRKVLADMMSMANLAKFDAVYFDSTVGELPFPDKDGFFKWVSDGHAVIANHAGSDSMHQTPEYAVMLGGEFQRHGNQAKGKIVNFDPKHPAGASWGTEREVYEELYMFRPNYDRTKVHSILSMVEAPADGIQREAGANWFPVAWTKMYGKGRVFFTSLGHREDVVMPDWKDNAGNRQNAPEIAEAYQKHLLGGIRWALGLAEGDNTPDNAK